MLRFWPIIATNRLISFQWTKLFKFKGIFLSVCIYSRSDTSMCVSNDSNLSPNSLPSGNCCLPAFSTVQASTLESVTPNHETYLASRRLAVSSSCDGITPVRDEESLPESEEQCTTINSDHNLILDSSVITEYTSSYAKANS